MSAFPAESLNFPLDAGELSFERGFDPRRAPISLCYFADMVAAQSQAASHASEDSVGELRSIDRGIHIIRKGERDSRSRPVVTLKGKNYDRNNFLSIKIMPGIEEKNAEVAALRVRALRKSLGLNQAKFAKLLSTQRFPVSQSLVSKWESGDLKPAAAALARISEVAEEKDRQWWRDRAAMQAGIATGEEGKEIPLSGKGNPQRSERNIPVINPSKVGELGTVNSQDVEEQLHLPANWFSGGEIRAVRVHDNPISPAIAGDYLAILDVSRRDPDRLTNCIVATRSVGGITARWLRRDGSTYFLQSLNDAAAPPRLLRHDGEDSVVGLVLKWIGDAPAPQQAKPHETAHPSKRRLARKRA